MSNVSFDKVFEQEYKRGLNKHPDPRNILDSLGPLQYEVDCIKQHISYIYGNGTVGNKNIRSGEVFLTLVHLAVIAKRAAELIPEVFITEERYNQYLESKKSQEE